MLLCKHQDPAKVGCREQSSGASTSVCLNVTQKMTPMSEDDMTGFPGGSELDYCVSVGQPAPLRNFCGGCSVSWACKKDTQLKALSCCQVA